jgi:hypothetical protein
MNDKNIDTRQDDATIRAAIIRALESRGRKARFVSELMAALARFNYNAESVERSLANLAAEGAIMVRDHFCADPHLAGVDLRIAALVADNAEANAQMNAIRAIDGAWDKWLGEYLANHRCT